MALDIALRQPRQSLENRLALVRRQHNDDEMERLVLRLGHVAGLQSDLKRRRAAEFRENRRRALAQVVSTSPWSACLVTPAGKFPSECRGNN
jgi:hypothetical protein